MKFWLVWKNYHGTGDESDIDKNETSSMFSSSAFKEFYQIFFSCMLSVMKHL